MNRTEYMRQLESLLQIISVTEREEALQYYNEYFNDAGPENEQNVIEALGNPAKVAENIKKDILQTVMERIFIRRSMPTTGRSSLIRQIPLGRVAAENNVTGRVMRHKLRRHRQYPPREKRECPPE